MALRVLLADNSESIRKAIEVSLSEYQAEVRSVTTGLDAFTVAKDYNPDIILIDILLQKKNGYEVTKELKADPATSDIPVILMWSSFMEIDEAKASECGADGRIEKPFDQMTLKNVVNRFIDVVEVEETQQAPPQAPDFMEEETIPPPSPKSAPPAPEFLEMDDDNEVTTPPTQTPTASAPSGPPPIPPKPPIPTTAHEEPEAVPEPEIQPEPEPEPEAEPEALTPEPDEGSWNMESFDDIKEFEAGLPDADSLEDGEDFQQVPLSTLPEDATPEASVEGFDLDDDIGDFEVDIPEDDFEGVNIDIKEPEEEIADTSFLLEDPAENPSNDDDDSPSPEDFAYPEDLTNMIADTPEAAEIPEQDPQMDGTPAETEEPSIQKAAESFEIPTLSIEEQKKIFEEKMEEAIQKLVPQIATKLIKEEIDRLLKDEE